MVTHPFPWKSLAFRSLSFGGPEDECGRGLELVAALATTWGANPRGPGRIGKTVWFELTGAALEGRVTGF
ncbi:hypothetical protein [Kitasatospora purpeofusca]|uniref:hypothetical protein n=1 Tax=Kitasatospora purpeofusca TaxID=67352 RepID=UPI00225A7B28|nr:hypothetical protein [Kitasatospora purpeofusca]MCX4754973.1 hypothetical protein [Kitasatospora purpeofusca]WSR37603.1 hypothetical protein OG715_27240 [Kitasatospora purpeofusca]WSR45840.1 hypothetical protein OG196_27805 [Kitasatospora purpeofusca]